MKQAIMRSLVCVAALVVLAGTVSCGSDPAATGVVRHTEPDFDLAIYHIAPPVFYNPVIVEIRISWENGVWARRWDPFNPSEDEEASRLLTPTELAEFSRLFEPFSGYEADYTDPTGPLEATAAWIELQRGDEQKRVTIYPAYYRDIPDELSQLRRAFDELGRELLEADVDP